MCAFLYNAVEQIYIIAETGTRVNRWVIVCCFYATTPARVSSYLSASIISLW
jgi:hypothetical protein